MSIPLLSGRGFTAQDTTTTPRVVVISETMARRYWPGQDPIGKRIGTGRIQRPEDWTQVIGVVKDVRQFELAADVRPQMYLPHTQRGFFPSDDLVVKTDVDPASMASTVRNAVWEIDKDQPVSNIRTMEEILLDSIARQRFSMLLLAIFAAVALALAAVGIYGVMSYSVAQRTHEIGIRMALGAAGGDVLGLVVRQTVRLVVIGAVLGLAGALALGRALTSLVFEVKPSDPTTLVAVTVLLGVVAIIATLVPAVRATRVTPLVALRRE
jgi:putative ABC transport system permease protein